MQMFFSPSTRGFYCVEVHGDKVPPDAKAISDTLYKECLSGTIAVDAEGLPFLWVPPPPTDDDKRKALKAAAAKRRWEVEEGGITLGGTTVATTKADQNRITSVLVNAGAAGIESVDFKAASGWVTLTLEQLQAIANAVAQHVQQCFSAERAHCSTIDGLKGASLDTYDVNVGWP